MSDPNWKTGFEIELLAPRGRTRRDLAQALTDQVGGAVHRAFHPQSEISEVPGLPVFENLTLAFDAVDRAGQLIARCADDLTIMADLDQAASSLPGWYRIVSDDSRFLRLIMQQCDPARPHQDVLKPVAALFGTDLQTTDELVRLDDTMGASIAIAATLPNERERPCEVITPPLTRNHRATLARLLDAARDLHFTVPLEAAVHVHFDATRLRDAKTLSRLIRLLHRDGDRLKELVGTNPNCRRLGSMPDDLVAAVTASGFTDLDWPAARMQLSELELSKYTDFNFLNIVYEMPGKPTFEVRIFPGAMDADQILAWTRLFVGILEWAGHGGDALPDADRFYRDLSLPDDDRERLGLRRD